jgi:mono/diheme cytochrome c family protein
VTPDTASTVVLARIAGRLVAYVADTDDAAVRTLDADGACEIAVTPLDGAPASLLVLADGRVVVALRDRARVEILAPAESAAAPLVKRGEAATPAEPVGMAVTLDGATLLVASRWAHALTAIDAATLERRFSVDLPRDPQAVIASSDGKRAFVSHLVGSRISVVDLGERRATEVSLRVHSVTRLAFAPLNVTPYAMREEEVLPITAAADPRTRFAGQGFALVRGPGGRILAPEVLVDPGTRARSAGYGEQGPVVAEIAALDERTGRRVEPPATAAGGAADECLLPRAAVMEPDGDRLLVACAGLDEVVSMDPRPIGRGPKARMARHWEVAGEPDGIAVDAASMRAFVWAAAARQLDVLDVTRAPDPFRSPERRAYRPITVTRRSPAPDAEVARGRSLFHNLVQRRSWGVDLRSCASCHPDGRDDGLTWSTPDGPRQTPMLADRLDGTAPYGWDGARPDLMGHLDRTLERLGHQTETPEVRRALLAYVRTLHTPAAAPPEDAIVARGSAIFHAAETGCAGCHLGDDTFTDGARHDVGSRATGDRGAAFDTPSLRFVGRSSPYFHDGRYPTLRAMLLGARRMGHASALGKDVLAALIAYLEVL